MVFSGPQTILCILLLLIPVATARPQSVAVADKAATSTISGKVTVSGKGLQGVVVGLVLDEQWGNYRPTRFRTITDEDGNYRITNVPPGNYDVRLASPVYVATEARKSVIVGKNETVENIDIALERGGVITGKVTDADGHPVIEETVYVTATTSTPAQARFSLRNIRTDDRGIYRAYGLPVGKYTVSAGSNTGSSVGRRQPETSYQRTYYPRTVDPAAATVIDVSEGSEATNVDIMLGGPPPRTYSARGRIIDGETDKPIPNLRVGVQTFWQHGTSAMGGVTETNKDGEFNVENLGPGKYAVYSEPPAGADWYSEAAPFEVGDQDVEGLVIKTYKGASVSGVVVLEGTNDPKVIANLLAGRIDGSLVGALQTSAFGSINPDGSFRITGLPSGRIRLLPRATISFELIRLERDGMVFPESLELKEREQITGVRVVVGHANGAIRGVIKLPTGFEMPATAWLSVHVRRTDNPIPGAVPAQVDARGHFHAQKLIPGTYEVNVRVFMDAAAAQSPKPLPAKQTVVVTNGAVADVTITLLMPKPAISKP